jgi:hypothetical protein
MTLVPLVIVAWVELFVSVTLVSAIPFWLYFVAALCGAAYANLVIGFLPNNTIGLTPKRVFQLLSLVGLFAIGIAPYLFRQFVLFGAFAFTHGPIISELYRIDGASFGRRSADQVSLKPLTKEGRRFRVPASADLPERYSHISTHGIDCVRLQTQTGRWGVKRVRSPSIYDAEFHDDVLTSGFIIPGCKISDRND